MIDFHRLAPPLYHPIQSLELRVSAIKLKVQEAFCDLVPISSSIIVHNMNVKLVVELYNPFRITLILHSYTYNNIIYVYDFHSPFFFLFRFGVCWLLICIVIYHISGPNYTFFIWFSGQPVTDVIGGKRNGIQLGAIVKDVLNGLLFLLIHRHFTKGGFILKFINYCIKHMLYTIIAFTVYNWG